jgi:Fe-S-cluster containining protein/glycosyltransferase involved in cell wall biosynthesis
MSNRPLDGLIRLRDIANATIRVAAASGSPARLAKAAQKIHFVADQAIDAIQNENKDQLPACKLGCDICCHRLVPASIPEVLSAAQYVQDTWTLSDIESFRHRCKETEEATGAVWRKEVEYASIPCPFLVESACSIYSHRPLSCRSINSYDASACLSYYQNENGERPPENSSQNVVLAVASDISSACLSERLVAGMFEFAPAVLEMLNQPGQPLKGYVPSLERLKVQSEWTSEGDRTTDFVSGIFHNETGRKILAAAGLGEPLPLKNLDLPQEIKVLFGMSAPSQFHSVGDLNESWEMLDLAIREFEKYEGPPAPLLDLFQMFNNFHWAFFGKDVLPFAKRLMVRLHFLVRQSHPQLAEFPDRPRRPGRFRLGYVSHRFSTFNGSRWVLGTLKHQSNEIETFVINLVPKEDETSLSFRRLASNYLHAPFPTLDVAPIIQSLDLDALIFTDVGMSGASLQLSAMKLARRQLTGWGHPVTTGSPTMDDYISCSHMEPINGQDHYSENLIQLPRNGLSVNRSLTVPSSKPASDLGLPDKGFLLFCQNLSKLTPYSDPLFKEIILKSPIPLVVIRTSEKESMEIIRKRLGTQNVIYLDRMERRDYLRALQLADASLESPSFGGGFTAIDAMSLGTPIITLPGKFMRSRLSHGFLRECGVNAFIAKNEADYVDLVTNKDRRDQIFKDWNPGELYASKQIVEVLEENLLA